MAICADYKSGATVPRPLASTVPCKTVGDVLHFDLFHNGESEVASAVDTQEDYKYILVVDDHLSRSVCLALTKAYTSNFTAWELVRWCALLWTLRVWLSEQ